MSHQRRPNKTKKSKTCKYFPIETIKMKNLEVLIFRAAKTKLKINKRCLKINKVISQSYLMAQIIKMAKIELENWVKPNLLVKWKPRISKIYLPIRWVRSAQKNYIQTLNKT